MFEREAAMQCFVSNSFINMIIIFPLIIFSLISEKEPQAKKPFCVFLLRAHVYVREIIFFVFFPHSSFFSVFVCMKKITENVEKSQCRQWIRNRQAKFSWRDATGFLLMFFCCCFFWILMPAGVSSLRVTWPACFPLSSQELQPETGLPWADSRLHRVRTLIWDPASGRSQRTFPVLMSIARVSMLTPGLRNSLHLIRTEWNENHRAPALWVSGADPFGASYSLSCVLQTPCCQC